MQSREQIAGEEYASMEKTVRQGNFCFDNLATHLTIMVNGLGGDGVPLWPIRHVPPEGRVIKLDSFFDYLFKPCREGLGLKNPYQVEHGLLAIGDKGKEALTAIRSEIPDWDARVAETAESIRRDKEGEIPAAMTPEEAGKLGGRGKKATDNVRGFGNTREYRIAQLKKAGREDLVEKVISGELSANAAAIAAGLKRPPKPRPTTPAEVLDMAAEILKSDSRVSAINELLQALTPAEFSAIRRIICMGKAA